MSNSTYILDETLLASNGKRFLNYILDTIFIIALVFLLSILLALAALLLGFKGVLIWMGNVGTLEERLIFVVIAIFYYAFAEGLFSRSLGKLITGTIVVDENGKRPAFSTVFKRSLCRAIPFDALSFLGSSGRGWHDSISDTYVVNKKALDEEVKNFYEFNLIGVQETE